MFRIAVKLFLFAVSMMILYTVVSCSSQRAANDDQSVRTTEGALSVDQYTARIFDAAGEQLLHPQDCYELSVQRRSGFTEVAVALRKAMPLNSSYIELGFSSAQEHPVEIQCGEAMLNYSPITYLGSPRSGLIISAQVFTNNQTEICTGNLLRVKFASGKQEPIRTLSDFNQDPINDPIITGVSYDPTDKNKLYWEIHLRGEANQNLVFDFADFGCVGANYNKSTDTTPTIEPCDGSNNKKVDFADFGIIGANYNKGIGGIEILTDSTANPAKMLGILSLDSKTKGDFIIDKSANKVMPNGFKQYWHTFTGTNRYVKLQLMDSKSAEVKNHNATIDTSGEPPSARGDWWMLGHDTAHSHRSAIIGPKLPIVSWKYLAGDAISSAAAVAADGTIYFGADDNTFYALNSTGNLKWKYSLGDPTAAIVWSSPAIGNDGTIYFGAGDYNIYALKPNGTVLWKYLTGSFVHSSPVIDKDGNVVIASQDKYLYSIKPDGKLNWKFDIVGEKSFSSPALDEEGNIYVGSTDEHLYAIKPDGTLKWKYKSGGVINSSPAIGTDGSIYFGCWDNKLYAVKSDGTLNWTAETAMMITSSPALNSDGSILIGSWDGFLYSFSTTGTQLWKYNTKASIVNSCPLIDGNGVIFIGTSDKNIHVINPDGTQKFSLPTSTGDFDVPPAIGADGKIYIGSQDKYMYAIGSQDAQAELFPPTNVTASDATSGFKITVSWTPPTKGDAPTGYKIYRATTENGTYSNIAEVGDVTTYDDSTVPNTDTYWYKVSAIKGMDESDLSTADSGAKKAGVTISRGDWWMFGREQTHGFSSPFVGPSSNTIKWSTETQGSFSGSSAMLSDGTVISCSNGTTSDYYLFAFNPDGTERWKYSFTKSVLSSPAIGEDGTIYVGCQDENLHAINPDGTTKWKYSTDPANSDTVYGYVNSSPSIAPDGTIYVGCNDSKLYAINPDGTKKWVFDVEVGGFKYPNMVKGSPAIDKDGTIYFGNTNTQGFVSGFKFYAVKPDGSKKWELACGAVDAAPTLSSDGTVYFESADNNIYAVNTTDGSVKWKYLITTAYIIKSSVVISADGTLYLSGQESFYALNSNGTLKWKLDTTNKYIQSPVIDKNGILYLSEGPNLIALKPDKSEVWRYTLTDDKKSFNSPIISEDGILYVGSGDKFFYAFGPK